MIIRKATGSDIGDLIELGAAMHAESPRYRDLEFVPEKLAALADHVLPLGLAIVADDGGVLVGMLIGLVTEHWFSTTKMATDLATYISPRHRGGTLLWRLVKAFEVEALRHGASEVSLGISSEVATEQTAALYARLGYERSSIGMVKYVRPGHCRAAAAG